MALIPRPAKAHILIGLAPLELQNFKGKSDLGMSHIHSKLAKALPAFNIHVYTAPYNQNAIHVFNAFLNFEIATYKDKKIHYPQLEENVKNIIADYFDSLQPADITQEPTNQLGINFDSETCQIILYWLSAINRINSTTSDSACRLSLHLSNRPELTLKNYKNEVLLISDLNVTEEALQAAIQLLLEVQKTAQQAGELTVKEDTPIKTNSHGAIDMQSFNNDTFYGDKLLTEYIEIQSNKLKKIDTDSRIENHLETIWQNFILSFKNGVMSKLTKINLQIDF